MAYQKVPSGGSIVNAYLPEEQKVVLWIERGDFLVVRNGQLNSKTFLEETMIYY